MITNYAVISVLARGSEALIKNHSLAGVRKNQRQAEAPAVIFSQSLAVAARPEDVKTKAPILNRDRQGAVFD
jgi:hypothetical protein